MDNSFNHIITTKITIPIYILIIRLIMMILSPLIFNMKLIIDCVSFSINMITFEIK